MDVKLATNSTIKPQGSPSRPNVESITESEDEVSILSRHPLCKNETIGNIREKLMLKVPKQSQPGEDYRHCISMPYLMEIYPQIGCRIRYLESENANLKLEVRNL